MWKIDWLNCSPFCPFKQIEINYDIHAHEHKHPINTIHQLPLNQQMEHHHNKKKRKKKRTVKLSKEAHPRLQRRYRGSWTTLRTILLVRNISKSMSLRCQMVLRWRRTRNRFAWIIRIQGHLGWQWRGRWWRWFRAKLTQISLRKNEFNFQNEKWVWYSWELSS